MTGTDTPWGREQDWFGATLDTLLAHRYDDSGPTLSEQFLELLLLRGWRPPPGSGGADPHLPDAAGEPIAEFRGEYGFLSNFAPSPVTVEGMEYPTVEHLFQACKTDDPEDRAWVAAAETPGIAKRRGRKVELVPDWETRRRYAVMRWALHLKFSHPELRAQLLATGDRPLIETTTWHDLTWGVCVCDRHRGAGHNLLGWMLSELRRGLRSIDQFRDGQ